MNAVGEDGGEFRCQENKEEITELHGDLGMDGNSDKCLLR